MITSSSLYLCLQRACLTLQNTFASINSWCVCVCAFSFFVYRLEVIWSSNFHARNYCIDRMSWISITFESMPEVMVYNWKTIQSKWMKCATARIWELTLSISFGLTLIRSCPNLNIANSKNFISHFRLNQHTHTHTQFRIIKPHYICQPYNAKIYNENA